MTSDQELGNESETEIEPAPSRPQGAVYSLRRPTIWSTGLIIICVIAAAFVAKAATQWWSQTDEFSLLKDASQAFFWLGLSTILLGWRLFVRRRPLCPISFHEDFVELPLGVSSLGSRRIHYQDVLSFHLSGEPPFLRLLIESSAHIFQFHQRSFSDPTSAEKVFLELRQRIQSLPRGEVRLANMNRRQTLAGLAMAHRPLATEALLGLIAIFFLNQHLSGSLESPMGVVRWGANSSVLVKNGELFRLLAANFLHGDILHLTLNGIALYSLGGVMERLLGLWRYLLVYLLAGLGATITSCWVGTILSVGASGAIFGLLGGLAVTNFRYRTRLPLGFRQPTRWWIFILAINGLLPFLFPQIDVAAHVSGFVVGGLVTFFLLKPQDPFRHSKPHTSVKVAAIGLTILYAVGLGAAVWYAAHYDKEEERTLALQVAESETAAPGELNNLAWLIAINPDSQAEDLEIAQRAAQRALRAKPDDVAIRDTAATVQYRRGNFEAAIIQESELLEYLVNDDDAKPLSDIGVYASQLQRFLIAGRANGLESRDQIKIDVEPSKDGKPGLKIEIRAPVAGGMTAYAIAVRGQQNLGLLQLQIGSDSDSNHSIHPQTRLDLARQVRFEVVRVKLEVHPTVEPKAILWNLWPTDHEVALYP